MLDRVSSILATAGGDSPRLRPTELYNEGWMLRLILDWAETHAARANPLFFDSGARWFAEALLPSQFLARWRGDDLAETWTHADGVIGHFQIGVAEKAALALDTRASQFVVVEAKMFSGLSAGVTHAPKYNQAARTVACIAEVLRQADRLPSSVPRLAFYVIAPEEQIKHGVFGQNLENANLRDTVKARVDRYNRDNEKERWFEEWFTPTLAAVRVSPLPWESVVDEAGPAYRGFYELCVKFNRPPDGQPVA